MVPLLYDVLQYSEVLRRLADVDSVERLWSQLVCHLAEIVALVEQFDALTFNEDDQLDRSRGREGCHQARTAVDDPFPSLEFPVSCRERKRERERTNRTKVITTFVPWSPDSGSVIQHREVLATSHAQGDQVPVRPVLTDLA